MAKYFEAINDNDDSIVIDDTFKNVEVLDSFPLSQCRFVNYSVGSNYGFYSLLRTNDKTALVGISLNPLEGIDWFMFNSTYGAIYFFDGTSGIREQGVFPVKRDDISSVATVYLLGFAESEPSTHGVGLEIINTDGNVVYSSNGQYLDIVACSSVGTQIPLTDNMIFFTLGTDYAADIKESHSIGRYGAEYTTYPAIEVKNGIVSVSPRNAITYYFEAAELEEWQFDNFIDEGSLFFGYLIGKL